MGVLVSSGVTKSGSTISSNTASIVVVEVGPGYAGQSRQGRHWYGGRGLLPVTHTFERGGPTSAPLDSFPFSPSATPPPVTRGYGSSASRFNPLLVDLMFSFEWFMLAD